MYKRSIAVIAAAVLLLVAITGCGGQNARFRYDFSAPVTNIDPQFVTDTQGKVIVYNAFEGLLQELPSGEIIPAAAEEFNISPDLLTYTFTLREGLTWSDGTALTAQDYVFALHRLFNPQQPSPYAGDYLAIAGAEAILASRQPLDTLGVTAEDDRTVVIRLQRPQTDFARLLTQPAAMPCNQAFFLSTKGRYGTGEKTVLTNGPFYLRSWDAQRILLDKWDSYHSAQTVLPQGVNFYIGREDPQDLLLSGKADAGELPYAMLTKANAKKMNAQTFENTLWCLAFNQENPLFASADVRKALQMSLDLSQITAEAKGAYIPTQDILPAQTVVSGKNYRATAGTAIRYVYNPQAAKALFTGALEKEGLSAQNIDILLPQWEVHITASGRIQRMWQSSISFYVNLKPLPMPEFTAAITARQYDVALVPITLTLGDVEGFFNSFSKTSSKNFTALNDPEFETILQDLAAARSTEEMIAQLSKAEDFLLDRNVLLPLYFEKTAFVTGQGVQGIEYTPYSGKILFRYAAK